MSGLAAVADSNTLLTTIKNTIDDFARKAKTKKRQKNSLPWFNTDVWRLMKQRDHALKQALKSKLEHDKRTFVMLRNKVIKELRKAKANFFINIIGEARGNAKLIWKQIKKLTGKQVKRTFRIGPRWNSDSGPTEIS